MIIDIFVVEQSFLELCNKIMVNALNLIIFFFVTVAFFKIQRKRGSITKYFLISTNVDKIKLC